uniref:Pseudouridine synthase RsuA/RluA-like domain-containing protein n=1 Tax=Chromera velia CCMP2878 TaxID=1169474 RepID=A0A0G4I9G9_9ALVE|eukprot:Cvel_12268.t1-p1 / transcript=Cvel_12268.t1 / gene=Cvel_12268 / organism=Chromera_velia_CCMP2878 / gene_product=Uncharacterized RNA pseudouridine synthase RBE_0321, putative / transcript_product=Uncharacterized RNA pseudouridine synthase RBE_0321, putative / location=Cvel_scaffold795:25215-26273(-) / protein_length=353 / sequence_SO=supercontig / SO=protein_coding / is_pseudo=false
MREGEVTVNGQVVNADLEVPDSSLVFFRGYSVPPPPTRPTLWGARKPRGVLCTLDAKEDISTLGTLLRKGEVYDDKTQMGGFGVPHHAYMVRRLPVTAEGIVMLTNDPEFRDRLTDPLSRIQTMLHVKVHGLLPADNLRSMWHGVTVRGVYYGPVWVELMRRSWSHSWLRVRLVETGETDLRELFRTQKLEVKRIRRYAFGPYRMTDLTEGALVPLSIHPALHHLIPRREKRMALTPARGQIRVDSDSGRPLSIFEALRTRSVAVGPENLNSGAAGEGGRGTAVWEAEEAREEEEVLQEYCEARAQRERSTALRALGPELDDEGEEDESDDEEEWRTRVKIVDPQEGVDEKNS